MPMVQKVGNSVARTAHGKELVDPIPYDYKWTEYETIEDVIAAKDELTAEEVVKTRNTERLNNARTKALSAALDAAGIVKPTAENDPQVALKDMVKTLLTAKLPNGERRFTEAQAREIAATNLGVEWAK